MLFLRGREVPRRIRSATGSGDETLVQESNVNVFFAMEATPKFLESIPRPALIIVPTGDGFNDFSLFFRVRALVIDAQGEAVVQDARLLFEGDGTTRSTLSALTPEGPVPVETVTSRFCFIFADESGYRSLTAAFGPEAARNALRVLNDVVLLEAEGSADIEDLIGSERFAIGVVREAETHRARRRARRLLGSRPPPVSDVSKSFKVVAPLPQGFRTVEVSFDFTSDTFLRDRMAVLIGPNGIGKSSILAGLIGALSTGSGTQIEEGAQLFPRPDFNRLIVVACTPSDVYPKQLSPWGSVDYHFITTLPQYPPDLDERSTRRETLTDALVDILRDTDQLYPGMDGGGDLTRFELLEKILPPTLWSGVRLPLRDDSPTIRGAGRVAGQYLIGLSALTGEKKKLITFGNVDVKRQPVHVGSSGIRTLSSGELSLFRLAVQLVSAVEPASLVLVDEPETHLHPRFVSQVVELLDALLKATNSAAIIATHSPFVVREVPRKRVQILVSKGAEVIAVQPHLQTFGASIDAIARVVFGDADVGVDHLHEKLISHWLATDEAKDLNIEQIIDRYGADLNPEMLSYIARRIK